MDTQTKLKIRSLRKIKHIMDIYDEKEPYLSNAIMIIEDELVKLNKQLRKTNE